MRKNNKIIFLLLALLSIFCFTIESYCRCKIIIVYTDKQLVVFEDQVKSGDIFSISYMHSVAKTPVIEIFEINDQYQIVLKETHTVSTGAGLPSQTFGEEFFVLEDNKFKIKNINRVIPEIPFMINENRSDTFYFKDNILDLSSLIHDGVVYIKLVKNHIGDNKAS